MALLERRLHDGALPRALRGLPPLLAMETLLFRIIWAGFILLTLTLASGVAFSEELFGKAAKLNHKTVFGVLSWIVFAALLAGRHIYGWRGRVAVRWTLAGFLMLVLAYIGSKFVLEVILGR
ncbi:Inner membrane protein YpjD [compost metagenome]